MISPPHACGCAFVTAVAREDGIRWPVSSTRAGWWIAGRYSPGTLSLLAEKVLDPLHCALRGEVNVLASEPKHRPRRVGFLETMLDPAVTAQDLPQVDTSPVNVNGQA